MFKTKKTLQMLNFTHCSKTPFTIFYVKNKKMEIRMSKRHILKEVNAKSMCGMEIVVEQIFENTLEKNLASAEIEQNWANSNMRCDSLKSLMIINKLSKFL